MLPWGSFGNSARKLWSAPTASPPQFLCFCLRATRFAGSPARSGASCSGQKGGGMPLVCVPVGTPGPLGDTHPLGNKRYTGPRNYKAPKRTNTKVTSAEGPLPRLPDSWARSSAAPRASGSSGGGLGTRLTARRATVRACRPACLPPLRPRAESPSALRTSSLQLNKAVASPPQGYIIIIIIQVSVIVMICY